MPEPTAPKPSFREIMAANLPNDPKRTPGAPAAPATPPAAPAAPAAPVTPPAPQNAPNPTPAPPTPSPVAPATPADPDEDILSGKRSPKAADFKRVKQSAQEARQQAEEHKAKLSDYEKKLADLEKQPKHNAELIKALEKERDDYKAYKEKYDAVAVQFTPEFHKRFEDKEVAVDNALKQIIGNEPQAMRISQALRMADGPEKKRILAELTADMDPFTVGEINLANRELKQVAAERQSELKRASDTLANIAESRKRQEEELSTRRGKAFETVFQSLSQGEKAIPVYQKREGDEAWNQEVEQRSQVARAVFEGKFDTEEERAQASMWAAAAPGILKNWQAERTQLQAQLAEQAATIQKLRGANPSLAPTPTPTPAGGKRKTLTEVMLENAVHG